MLEPLIIGHRGASSVAPENTLIAFERAIADGADGVEFDVQLASDGRPVVIHDSTLKRTGLRRDAICDLSSGDLGKVDVGTWFNLRFPARARDEYAKATVPRLVEVLDLLKDSAAFLFIEMKWNAKQSRALAWEVATLVKQASLYERAIVVCFSLSAILEIKRMDGGIRTGALFEPKLTRPFPSRRAIIDRAMRYQADQILWHRSLASVHAIEETSQRGLTSTVWTVGHRSWITRAKTHPIHSLITNDPARMTKERDQLVDD